MWISKLAVLLIIFCGSSINFSLSTCGRKKSKEWPWVARIIRTNNEFLCSGTLISTKSVLSAASCFNPKESEKSLTSSDVRVQLGKHYLSRLENKSFIKPELIVIHKDWNPSRTRRYDSNLALLILPYEVEETDFISPVCLNIDPNLNADGLVVGWRFPENIFYKGSTAQDVPKEVEVKKISSDACDDWFMKLANSISNKTFCATILSRTSLASCLGSEGSGFFVQVEGKWFLDGVLSTSSLMRRRTESFQFENNLLITHVSKFENLIRTDWKAKKLHCELKIELTCKAQNLEIMEKFTILTLNDDENVSNVRAVKIENQEIEYFPRNLGKLFPNLRVIKARNSKLKTIRQRYFLNMPNIEVLDLPSNLLENIPSNALMCLARLQELDISRNLLKTLHSRTFFNNPNLLDIDASNNKIEKLEKSLFENNLKLKSIDFSNNMIKVVDFRFDERFSSVDLYLLNNLCFNQIFSIDAKQSFNDVNNLLAKNCTETNFDQDYLDLFNVDD